jgi:RHS repeat-associated protein
MKTTPLKWIVFLLVALCWSATVQAQSIESVLRALQERKQMLSVQAIVGREIQEEKTALKEGRPADYSQITLPPSFFISWPNGVEEFPEEGSIPDLETALAALNHASLMFDEIKGQYLAYDTSQKTFVNSECVWVDIWSGPDPLRSVNGEVLLSKTVGDLPEYARVQVASIRLPSIGEFTEDNWRVKLKLLASGISQLKALPWTGTALRATARFDGDAHSLNAALPDDSNPPPTELDENGDPRSITPECPKWKTYNSLDESWLDAPSDFPTIMDFGKVDNHPNDYVLEYSPARDHPDGRSVGYNSNSVAFGFQLTGAALSGVDSTSYKFPWRSGRSGQARGNLSLSWTMTGGRYKGVLNSPEVNDQGDYYATEGRIRGFVEGHVATISRVWPKHVTLPEKKKELTGSIHLSKAPLISSYADYTDYISAAASANQLPIGRFQHGATGSATESETGSATLSIGSPTLYQSTDESWMDWQPPLNPNGQLVAVPYRTLSSTLSYMRSPLNLPTPPVHAHWQDIPPGVISAFDVQLAPPRFDSKIFRIGASENESFPKNRPGYAVYGNTKSYHDGPSQSGESNEIDLTATEHVTSGGTYNVESYLVCVPNFTPLSSTSYQEESLAAYGLGTVETAIDLDLVRIHLGRGKTDANQVAWLSSRPDGFGSPIFHGSPDEFEILYEKNRANYEPPIGGVRKFDSPAAEFTDAQKKQSGWQNWFAYMAGWHTPRLRQIRGGDVLVDITYKSNYHKVLKFYWASDIGERTEELYTDLPPTPFKVVDLRNPSAPADGAGLPSDPVVDGKILKLLVGEDGKRFHKVTLTQTFNPETRLLQSETVKSKLMDSENADSGEENSGTTHRTVDATLNYAQGAATTDTWTITETEAGVVKNISETYAHGFSPRDTDNPVLKSRSVIAGGETRGFTTEWVEPGSDAVEIHRRDYRLTKVTFSTSETWASSGFEYQYSARGIPSERLEKIGGKTLKTTCSLLGNVGTETVKLSEDGVNFTTFTTSTVTYSHGNTSQRFVTATRQLEGETVATETYRNFSGAGAESGSPWSLEKVVYQGGYQETSRPIWSGGALTMVSKSGWTPSMKTGREVSVVSNQFSGLESGSTKARAIPGISGGESDIELDNAVVTEKTSFGAPKTISDLRDRQTTVTYEETGANLGLPKLATPAGLPEAGVTEYDWLGRPTAINGGHEEFTVNYTNIFKPKVTSNSNPLDHWSEVEVTPFGRRMSEETKFGVSSKTTYSANGGGAIEFDGLSTQFESDVSGVVSKVFGGLGAVGSKSTFGVETIDGKKCLAVTTTQLKRNNSDSALTIKTHYDVKGRVVRITRPSVNGSGTVFESWNYDDNARTVVHTPVPVPPPGHPAQTTTTTLDSEGHTITVKVDNEERLFLKRRSEAGELFDIVEKRDDGADGGSGVPSPAWKQVSKTAVSPAEGQVSFTPYDLADNAVTVVQTTPNQSGTVTTTVTTGLTGETITATAQNGLSNNVSGSSGGRQIAIDNIQHSAGHLVSTSGTIGGAPVGLAIGADRRVSQITDLEGTMTLDYSKPAEGFRIDGTLNGATSAHAEDAFGELTVLNLSGEIAPLSAGTIDTASGTEETLTVPGESGSLVIQRNLFGAVTQKSYAGGQIYETVSYHEDGTPYEVTRGGTSGSGTALTETTTWQSPYDRQTSYSEGPTIKEEFFKAGTRKMVQQLSSTVPDKREFTYQRDVPRTEKHTSGIWAGKTVTFTQDARGRLWQIVVSGGSTFRTFTFGYDGVSRVNSSSITTGTGSYDATMSYYPVHGRRQTTVSGSATSTRSYTGAGLLQGIAHTSSGTNISFGYPSRDAKLRITSRTASLGHGWSGMSYDARGQLQGVSVASVQNYAYAFNTRGNRTGPVTVATYSSNSLDQVGGRSLAEGVRGFGLLGAVKAGGNVLVEARNWPTPDWIELVEDPVTGSFYHFWPVPNTYLNGAAFQTDITIRATLPPPAGANSPAAVAESKVYYVVPAAGEVLSYDGQGRLREDALWTYEWDGRDRLLKMTHKAPLPNPETSSLIVDFGYDADGRRVQKKITTGLGDVGNRVEISNVLWAGWLPIMEERTTQEPGGLIQTYPRRWFQWGPDESGTLSDAGGIGGLVAIHEEAPGSVAIGRTLTPLDDGLGNIIALVDQNGKRVATYEYGPFGEWIGGYGEMSACPFRWQTKWFDAESDHYYFGYRYYCPQYGRWLSRDPLRESGGFNLYAYCGNDPVNRYDPLGLSDSLFELMFPAHAGRDDLIRAAREGGLYGAYGIIGTPGKVYAHPKVQGSLRMVGGGLEAGVGAVYTFGSDGIGAPLGGVLMMGNGADNFNAGLQTFRMDAYQPAFLERGITSVAGNGWLGNGLYAATQIGVGFAPTLGARAERFTLSLAQTPAFPPDYAGAPGAMWIGENLGEGGSLWHSGLPGIQTRRFGNWWVKRVNPDSNAFMQWWGRQSINAQYRGLQKLGDDMATANEMRDGMLFTRDVGPTFTGGRFSLQMFDPTVMNAYVRGSLRMGTPFNDIIPRNMGINGKIFDPSIDWVTGSAFVGGTGLGIWGVVELHNKLLEDN